MTKSKRGAPACVYCGEPVDVSGSHARSMATGQYCHINCFMEHEPRGKEIVERAKQAAIEELERATRPRVVH